MHNNVNANGKCNAHGAAPATGDINQGNSHSVRHLPEQALNATRARYDSSKASELLAEGFKAALCCPMLQHGLWQHK